MRTTIELPDELMKQAKVHAAASGISMRAFFVAAVEQKLEHGKKKVRRPPPQFGNKNAPATFNVTREQIDEALFG